MRGDCAFDPTLNVNEAEKHTAKKRGRETVNVVRHREKQR